MRRVRYLVATSLDGFIADAEDGYGWIPDDPAIDFSEILRPFDTMLVGRRTFEVMRAAGDPLGIQGMRVVLCSTTLLPEDHPELDIRVDACAAVRSLRDTDGKDIGIFGGGQLFGSLLEADLVDTVEVAVVPVLLGEGVPMNPPSELRTRLRLDEHRVYPSGIVRLAYEVVRQRPAQEG